MKLENEVAVIVPSTNGPSVADPVLIQTQIDKALVDLRENEIAYTDM